ncbi:MAG: hypothetical protein QOH21_902 [Acidobacteriota bacterium]|jgi:hypothetical protein|nr:hypothetical protein [Acidobacteriota bacterium]
MTEPTPDPAVAPMDERDPNEPEAAPLPRWVPVAIGVLLVVLGALAVATGLRYRTDTLVGMVRTSGNRVHTPSTPAPPGEPEAGASLVMPGGANENVPTANKAVTGDSRAVVTGGPGGVTSQVRVWARRGVVFEVTPEDAMLYVNDVPIGEARQFNSMDEAYELPHPGSYTVRVVADGYRERQFVVTAAEDAQQDIARLNVSLTKP